MTKLGRTSVNVLYLLAMLNKFAIKRIDEAVNDVHSSIIFIKKSVI